MESAKQAPLAGKGYHHDDNRDQGARSAVFSTKVTLAGDYEVRLLYVATDNRATRVPVKIQSANGGRESTLNQRESCLVDGVPRSLGVFAFAAGAEVVLTVSNRDADGYAVIDGLQIVPLEQAKAERAGERKSGFAVLPPVSPDAKADDKAAGHPLAAAVAVSPLARNRRDQFIRALLPQGVDNLLVPVCLGAMHVAWGAVRLEPVWMQTGEAAGFAAALSKQKHITPAALDADLLVRTLVRRRQMVSFFNDIKVTAGDPGIPAIQHFGTKGFFPGYDARADDPLDSFTADAWVTGLGRHVVKSLDPAALAARLARAEVSDAAPVTSAQFAVRLKQMNSIPADRLEAAFRARQFAPSHVLTRGEACAWMFDLLAASLM